MNIEFYSPWDYGFNRELELALLVLTDDGYEVVEHTHSIKAIEPEYTNPNIWVDADKIGYGYGCETGNMVGYMPQREYRDRVLSARRKGVDVYFCLH